MSDMTLHDYENATRAAVSPDFTAKLFTRIGVDRYVTAASALGPVYVAWRASGVCGLRLADGERAFEAWYAERFGRRVVAAVEDDPVASAARAKLAGEDVAVPLDLDACSPFEQRVLRAAAGITPGNARPYGWVARELGAPDATRAVGNALGRNPVPLLIPCHRVTRKGGDVGGYVFGSETKRKLLEAEGLDFGAIERVTRLGFGYVGNDEDGTFCLPTCGDVACHIDEPGFYGLRSAEEAHAHGFVPCTTCRPIAA